MSLAKKLYALFARLSHNLNVDLITNLLWKKYNETESNVYINMCNDRSWQQDISEHY